MHNQYVCLIDLHHEAKALQFASALDEWMEYLKSKDTIRNWHLLRRKLNLADSCFADFMLLVEVDDLEQLDRAFRVSGSNDEEVAEKYRAVHALIKHADFGLFRPFPDKEGSERMGLL